MNSGDMIVFDRKKSLKYIRKLGSGGTGDTHLFFDDTTEMYFAMKKYSPKDEKHTDEYYKRFVDEIKILLNLFHANIVRIYNYYLYPENKTGYIQMEYIDGVPIDDFIASNNESKHIETIVQDVISAFRYLESHRILHRDIRPANILIDRDCNVKIIDFGFGKQLNCNQTAGESVLLNWPVSEYPEEVIIKNIYNHQTEIYFIGKLFQHLVKDRTFLYQYVLDKMTKIAPEDRYQSFDEIEQQLSLGVIGEINFTTLQKMAYQTFADALVKHIACYVNAFSPIDEISLIIERMSSIIRKSSLEEYIQDNSVLIRAFIKGAYRYNPTKDFRVTWLIDFYKLLIHLDDRKKKIVLDNILLRLSAIKIEYDREDELPF